MNEYISDVLGSSYRKISLEVKVNENVNIPVKSVTNIPK